MDEQPNEQPAEQPPEQPSAAGPKCICCGHGEFVNRRLHLGSVYVLGTAIFLICATVALAGFLGGYLTLLFLGLWAILALIGLIGALSYKVRICTRCGFLHWFQSPPPQAGGERATREPLDEDTIVGPDAADESGMKASAETTFCPSCGADIPENATKCPSCGWTCTDSGP